MNNTFGLRTDLSTAPRNVAGNETAADAAATAPKKSRRDQQLFFSVVMLENLPPPAMKASLSLVNKRRMPRQPEAGLGKLGGQNGGKARTAKLSAIRFILEAKDATILLAEGNQEKKRDFLKKIGSNFQVADKSLAVEFKNPWSLLADFNSDLSNTHARQRVKSEKSNWRRERDSNPRYPFGVCTLSRRVPSTTRPSLRR